jgi:hypothetical protein
LDGAHYAIDASSLLPIKSIGNINGNTALMQTEINFSWWRERNRRDYNQTGTLRSGPVFADVLHGEEARIVAKGKSLERYQPLKEFPDLWARFAERRSATDIIEFVRTFGPYTEDGLAGGKGDDITRMLRHAEVMASGRIHAGFILCTLNARLTAEHDGIRLRIEPSNLEDALWLQYAQALAAGHANRCRHCSKVFATGPDAKRRKGAQFCSIECKTKFHSLKRSR